MKVFLLNTKTHDRRKFYCEEDSLTEYLQKQASQDMKKSLAACFVLIDGADNLIKGYYTLTSESLDRNEIPEDYENKIPDNYNVPVTLLGRLARDITMKGKGAGEFLLLDALWRSYEISKKEIGSMAVVVDPINEYAIGFYTRYGFILLPDSGKMFLPMKAISKLFDQLIHN
ncbi:MAG: GNAT family N-acetyltransferase [Bacteroidetes bacterium]|nr:GNAT family N-acetyltransferase [Bacteroidota bacterium]MBU1719076.1 GNAT family N-acetyltransferase [Bacteroidota bacterium]